MRNDSEKKVEAYLCERVKALGGLCIKLNPFWYFGIQDRLVLLRHGRCGFAELKRPKGGRHAIKQKWWCNTMLSLGYPSEFLPTEKAVDMFLHSL